MMMMTMESVRSYPVPRLNIYHKYAPMMNSIPLAPRDISDHCNIQLNPFAPRLHSYTDGTKMALQTPTSMQEKRVRPSKPNGNVQVRISVS